MDRLDWVGHGDAAQLYYNSIADRFASWGVDFIKFDGIEDYSTPGPRRHGQGDRAVEQPAHAAR